jgi:hypothetical protein
VVDEYGGHEPRASRIRHARALELPCEIWMGGSDSIVGEPVTIPDLASSIVVDCAGDLAEPLRDRCGLYVPRVFMDAEVRPFSYSRLAQLVHGLALVAGGAPAPADLAGDEASLSRIYIFCQYGMNRSGLITGMLLRALGVETEDALAAIRRARPGALSNHTFCALVADWRCPEATC